MKAIEERVQEISVDMFKKDFVDISSAEAYAVMYRIAEEREKEIKELKEDINILIKEVIATGDENGILFSGQDNAIDKIIKNNK